MSNFRVGQRVVCVDGRWACLCGCGLNGFGPKKEEVVTCDGDDPTHSGYVYLREYSTTIGGKRASFDARQFRPIIEQSLTAELAEKLTESIVEERPEHVNEPQYA